ncbi:hypothetical protein NECAME_09494 [Necator americanus]|uniref:Uncharacterized protein n=1 Tax=Necator americanus TaxID=51031 RepID=W2TDL9_NECAM|nr:hypothetical protein NECAME_09494 [Necator americanus]ETN79923.1 hypothetical protein NECAME_09494 [Necator americanus]
MAIDIDSFEEITIRIGRFGMRGCVSTPALTIFVLYAPKSSYGEKEIEAYMNLQNFYTEDHSWRFQRQKWPEKPASRTLHGDLQWNE